MSDSDLSDNNYEDFEDDVENSLSSDDGSETSNSSIKSMEVINPENVPNSVTNVNESPQMEESIFVDAKDGSESDSSSSDNINVQINTSPLGCTSIVEQEVHRDPKWMIDSLKGGKDSTDTSATNSAPLAKNSFELNGNLADKSDSAGNFNLSKADPSSSRQPPAHSSGLDQRVLAKFHSKAPQSYEIISPKSSIDDSNLNSKPFNEKLQAALTASKCAAHSSGLDRRAYAKYPTKEDLAKKEKELVKTYTSEPPSQSSGLDPRAFAMFPTAEDLSKLSASKNTQAAAKYSYYSSQLCTLLSSTAEQQTSNQQAVKTTKDKMKDLTISEPTTNFTTDPMDISNPPKFNSKLAELKDSRLKLIKLFAETKHLKILSELVQINQKITAMQGFDDIQILNPNSPSPSLAEAKPCSSKDEFYKRPSTVSLGSIISNINDMNARYAYEQKVMISGVEPSHECPFTKILKLKTATKTHQTMLEQFLNIFSIENPLIEVEKAKESCKKIYDAMPKAVKEASFLSACPFGDYFTDKKLDQIQLVESGGDEAVAALPKPMSLLNLNDPQPSQNSKFTVVTGPSFNILPTTPTTPATTAPTSTTATSSTIEDLAIAKNVAYLQMLQCETICLEQNTAAKSDMPEEDRQNFEKRSIKAETNLKAAKEKYEICFDIINSEAFNEMEEFTKICEAIKNSEAKNQAAATTTTSAKNPLFQKAEPKTPLFKYAAKKEAMSNSCNTKTSEDGCKEIISVIPPPKFSFLQDKFKPPALQKSNCDELKTPESISKNVPPPKSEFVFNYTDCAPARSSPVGDNSAIVNAKGETVKLRAKIWEHKSEIWELKSAIQNAEKNAPQNVIYNSPTVTSPGETAKLQADIRELKRAFQDTENSRKTLIEINETLKAENKWLKDAEKEHEKDLEFKDAKIAKLQRELEDQRECMKKSSQGMLGAYGQIAKYKKQIADYEGGITFEEKIREKNVEIEKLKTDIKNQSEIMKNNNQSLFDAYAEIAKYKKQIADYQSAKNFEEKIGEKNAEIEKLQAEIKNQGELMKQGSETILDSCAQIAQLKKQLADNQGRDEVAAIKADFEAQIKDLKAQEEEILQSYQEAFEEKDEKIAEFLSSLNELTQENSDYENQVQHLKEINMKLNRQLGEKDVEITFLKAPIQILRNPIFQKSKPAVKNEMVQQQKREELERKKSEMRKMISEREKANTEQESLSKSKRNEEMIQATK
uniref:Uncharacterized protein n=1 Tax=Panagrolaimus sp. ES5 TaxID=591445 RepID=A0AC34F1X1_9BILA